MLKPLELDTFRYRKTKRRRTTLRLILTHRTFRVVATLRWCQHSRGLLRIFYKVLHRWACAQAAIDLPSMTQIGPGLAIHHGWGIVINRDAMIGRNVTIMHGVTIGQADDIAPDGSRTTAFPKIGDDVWIGPHAVIVGGINVGNGARVLGGAIVTRDVPAGAMVGGNPARIIRENAPPDVVNRVEAF